ncbi:MAG: hypothetical protein ACO202_07030, partial [Polynucleobacter sp.]
RQEPAKLRTGVRFPHAPPPNVLDESTRCPKIKEVGIFTHQSWKLTMNRFITKTHIVALAAAAMLGACATGDSPTGTQEEINQIQSQLLGDMPLPAGAKIMGSDSLIIGRGDGWVGRVNISALQGATDVYAFFQSEYPKAGWTTVTATKAKTSFLVFTKGERTCAVEINEGSLTGPKSIITITSSPKNANVIAPTRKP